MLRIAAFAFLFLIPGATAVIGHGLLEQRRDLLLRNIEVEVAKSVTSVASLVSERARDLRGDLVIASRVLRHAERSRTETLDLVRAQLIALNRTQKHYLTLWYVRGGEALATVSGQRDAPHLIPAIGLAEVSQAAELATRTPGAVVRTRAAAPEDSSHEHLRLFALAPPGDIGAFVVLVSLDRLFAALQRRARLPGTDLWVVDKDGTVLVDPGASERSPAVMELLTGAEPSGSRVIGPLPSLWPWSDRERDSILLAWHTNRGSTFHWTTGIAVPLQSVVAELRELSWQLFLFFIASLVAAGSVIVAIGWLGRRQRLLDERLRHLSRVNALRDQLVRAEKLSTFGQIAAGVAHEIGTPLGVISIRLDQLMEQSSAPRDRERVQIMKEQIERISRIIRQLLDYGRPQASESQPVSVRLAVERVAALMEPRLRKKNLELVIELPLEEMVLASLDQLHQVLLNLLVNAADACGPNGRITVSGRAAQKGAGLTGIEIADTGSGIPTEQRTSIFEPFVTSKPRGEGTGLGLTIVKDIVEGHGGYVDLESSEMGTRFVIWWPIPADPTAATAPETGGRVPGEVMS